MGELGSHDMVSEELLSSYGEERMGSFESLCGGSYQGPGGNMQSPCPVSPQAIRTTSWTQAQGSA